MLQAVELLELVLFQANFVNLLLSFARVTSTWILEHMCFEVENCFEIKNLNRGKLKFVYGEGPCASKAQSEYSTGDLLVSTH